MISKETRDKFDAAQSKTCFLKEAVIGLVNLGNENPVNLSLSASDGLHMILAEIEQDILDGLEGCEVR